MVAIMNEALELVQGLTVLEVGAGSGYHAATIAETIGPKTGLKMMQEYGSIEKIAEARPDFHPPEQLSRIRQIFLNPEVTSRISLEWREPDVEGLVGFLCGDRDFSEDRIRTAVAKAKAGFKQETGRKTLESFFSG